MSRQPAKLVQSISGQAPRNGVTPNATNARPHGSESIAELSGGISSRRFEARVRLKRGATVLGFILGAHARNEAAIDIGLEHPFASSGASIHAAERRGRRAAAIELDPINVDAAIGRRRSMAGKIAVWAKDGRALSEMQGDRSRAVELVDRIYDGEG